MARGDGRRKGLGKKATKKRAKNIHRGGHELIFGVVVKPSRLYISLVLGYLLASRGWRRPDSLYVLVA